jgi:hypothetical protein
MQLKQQTIVPYKWETALTFRLTTMVSVKPNISLLTQHKVHYAYIIKHTFDWEAFRLLVKHKYYGKVVQQ